MIQEVKGKVRESWALQAEVVFAVSLDVVSQKKRR